MIKIIRDKSGFKAIRHDWDCFIEKNGYFARVFLSYDWLSMWISYFLTGNSGKKLFIITECDDETGEIKAIAPFYIERFFFFFKCLRFISDDYSDYLGILSTDKISDILKETCGHLGAGFLDESKADLIYLKQVSDSLKDEINLNIGGLKNTSIFIKPSGDCYYIDMHANGILKLEDYLKKFNSKQRYNILKRVKNAEKKGVKYISVNAANEKPSEDFNFEYYIKEFFNLHQKRWNKKGKEGVFSSNKIKLFFQDLFEALYKKGILDLSFLKYGDKLIAGAVCFDFERKRQVYLPGFDPEYSYLHPGIVLTYNNINEAILSGCKEFDFLKGSEDYKKRFLAVKRKNFKIYIYKKKIIYLLFKLNIFLKNEIVLNVKRIFR